MTYRPEDFLSAALEYARRGWRVFPSGDVKGRIQPLIKKWQDTATTDASTFAQWWEQWPDAIPCIATGPGSNLLVVDLDEKHGLHGIAEFARVAPADYEYRGCEVSTLSGGRHLYYATEHEYHNTGPASPNKLGDGIDTRGWHGFVYAPPRGEWLQFLDRIPDVPEWMAEMLDAKPRARATSSSPVNGGQRSTLTALLADPPMAEGDGRNEWLIRVAGHYAKLFRHARDAFELHVLNAAALMAEPLSFSELRTTMESAWGMEERKEDASEPGEAPRFRVVSLAGIELRPVKYVWGEPEESPLRGGRLPVGSLALLGGREGVGKSTIVWDLTAALTRGVLPGVYFGQPTTTLVVATEDSFEHTIAPRLLAARADLHRVLRMDPEDPGASVILPRDIESGALTEIIHEHEVRFVVLDPLMSRLGSKLDTHKDADVRRALEPLSKVADETGVAVVGLIHVNKTATFDPLTSLMGSRAFTAVARSVLFTMYDPEAEAQRLLCHVKCNLGPLMPTLKYGIEELTVAETDEGPVTASHVLWRGEDGRTGRDLLEAAAREKSKRTSKAELCADKMRAYFKEYGPTCNAHDVKAAMMREGFEERTVERAAKERLGVKRSRRGTGTKGNQATDWTWEEPF